MDVKANINIHNRFDIVVKDAKTGEVVQTAQAENIVLNNIYNRLCTFSTYFDYILFGSGTGTPVETRTTLFNLVGYKSATTYQLVKSLPTSTWTRTIRLNVDEYNGYTIREVGIGNTTSTINTHALITDSVGNPIELVKDNTKIIDIYATVYITIYDVDSGLFFSGTGLRDYLTGSTMASDTISIGYVSDDDQATGTATRTYNVANKTVTTTYKFGISDFNKEVRYIQWNNVGLRCVLPRTGVFEGYNKTGVSIGTGDGTTTIFAIPNISIKNLIVYIDGNITTDYTVDSNNNIVFNTPPANNAIITADYTCIHIPKDSNHTLTVTMTLQYGGGQPTPVMPAPSYTGVPGSATVTKGSTSLGFYGEVASSDLISGDNLCSTIGLTAGTSMNSDGGWLKFAKENRIIFVSKKCIRYNLSWNDINAVGAVFGNKIITLNGVKYAIRLISSSEWDKLIYPVHVNYGTWATYTDTDLWVNSGNGSYTWTSTLYSGSYRVVRGNISVSDSNYSSPGNADARYGFRPCLEVL